LATRDEIEKLKRRHARRLLRLSGVSGVGVERSDDDAYILVVHVTDDEEKTRTAVQKEMAGAPVRVVKGNKFKKL
jgi:hypothetical protein